MRLIELEVEISSELPMVMVDPVLFEQVLFNLLDNAAKYAPPDTTTSVLSWRTWIDGNWRRRLDPTRALSSGK